MRVGAARRGVVAALGSVGLVVWVLVAPVTSASAAPPAVCSAGTCTVTFTATGTTDSWTVPAGVRSVTARVAGASGGDAYTSHLGGAGGVVTTTISVTAGETFAVAVGEAGTVSPTTGSGPIIAGGAGGYGGGGTGGSGPGVGGTGGGGGSFLVRTSPTTAVQVVAGGGGGGGFAQDGGAGGAGGNGSGAADSVPGAGDAGAGGTTTAGGAGGGNAHPGVTGTGPATSVTAFGTGGDGADDYLGGGGGGGYFGGGGGGDSVVGSFGYSGAGGGGSGYLASGLTATATTTNTGNGSIVLTYLQPVATVTALTVVPAGPINAGTPSTLTVNVTSSPSGSTPTGTVTFTDGPTALGTGSIVGGFATLTVTLPLGTHTLAAAFAGTGAFIDSATTNVVSYAVEAATVTAAQSLPATGADAGLLVAVALALLAVGGGMLALERRRSMR